VVALPRVLRIPLGGECETYAYSMLGAIGVCEGSVLSGHHVACGFLEVGQVPPRLVSFGLFCAAAMKARRFDDAHRVAEMGSRREAVMILMRICVTRSCRVQGGKRQAQRRS